MQKEEQKIKLEKELLQLEKELHNLGRKIGNNGEWVVSANLPLEERIDPLDDANLTEEVQEDMAIFHVLIQRYEQLKKALNFLEKGNYGVCEVCKKEISKERLRVNPSATTCILHTN